MGGASNLRLYRRVGCALLRTACFPLLLFALLAAHSIHLGWGQARESDAVAAALAELNKGNVFESISRLKRIVEEKPVPQAYFYLSGLYARMGRNDLAYNYLAQAMRGNPPQGVYYDQLGLIRRYEGCRPEALAAFTRALQLGMGRDEATVWRHAGDVHVDLLEWDKAIDAYRSSLRLRPDDAAVRVALGRLYVDRNDLKNAFVELRNAMEIAPATAGLYAALGRAYRAAGDSESAISILTKGLEQDPSDQQSRYILAQTLLAAGRANEGRQILDDYRQLQERMTQTNALFEAGVERARAGDLAGAEKSLREALKGAERYAPALQILGTVLLNSGSVQQALEFFRQSLAVNPLNSETYFNMGAAYLRLGNLDDALDMTEKALVIEDEDARLYGQLGEIYSRMNRSDRSQARARDRALEKAAALKSAAGYRPPDPYGSEGRHRNDAATVRQICSGSSLP